MENIILKKFGPDLEEKLPLTFRFLKRSDKKYYFQLIESGFHRDQNFLSLNYYKPISKSIDYGPIKKKNI